MKILALGHSHLTAIEHGFEQLASRQDGMAITAMQLWGRYDPIRDGNGINADLVRDLEAAIEAQEPDLIVAPILGGESFALAFSGEGKNFDYFSSVDDVPDSALDTVPHSLVLGRLREIIPYIEIAPELARMSGRPVFYPLPPPPGADEVFLTDCLPPALKANYGTSNLPPAAVRLKLWRDMGGVISEVCYRTPGQVRVMPPPPEALDENGLLRLAFMGDSVHGNAAYGALVLQEILKTLEG